MYNPLSHETLIDLYNTLPSFIREDGLAGCCKNTSWLDIVKIDGQIPVFHQNVITFEKLHFVNDDVVRTGLCSVSEDLVIPM